jgi:polysaccharide biosynthesis protein PslG
MRRLHARLLFLALALLLVATPALAAQTIGNDAFQRVWQRQDLPVAQQVSGRSWSWGPAPISNLMRESLVEAPEGLRAVQYFDKSRMEINDPTADPNATWYVTNGLLPIEMMTGRLQVGFDQFEARPQARQSVVGDPGQFPTYADLLPFYQSPGAVNPSDLGKPATGMINPDGSISGFNGYATDPATTLVRGENNHGVAKAFQDFMSQSGLVYENGRFVRSQVYDPLFVFGLPVTGAYWVNVNVGGVERPVLFQVFERRVLTYNPANEPAFRVEMGNVGQHYYQWRYPR